MIDKKRL